ncbi:hypothetical protein FF38_11046 [Lucilia cuprina]|uniref:Uncharacterized protein n=1 Tax=Lucilia cuprina TaxID=7375 RepID=A0A0L0CCW7_LUCCU|nr:hypothetical protein FF38_11046 [Lucilia cuprina]
MSPHELKTLLSRLIEERNSTHLARNQKSFSRSKKRRTSTGFSQIDNESLMNYNSVNKVSWKCLIKIMGLEDDSITAKERETYIFYVLALCGFNPEEETWIRDTTPERRDELLSNVEEACGVYGYTREVYDLIIRRGSYARMQIKLRNMRRARNEWKRRMNDNCEE